MFNIRNKFCVYFFWCLCLVKINVNIGKGYKSRNLFIEVNDLVVSKYVVV